MAHTSTTNQATSGAVKTDEVNYFFRDEHGEWSERDLEVVATVAVVVVIVVVVVEVAVVVDKVVEVVVLSYKKYYFY